MSDSDQMEFFPTSSPEDSPAKTSAKPVYEQEYQEPDLDSGPTSANLLAMYDLDLHFWKTSQHSLLATADDGLDEWQETWPRSGIAVCGTAYRLPNLAHTITEIASGLLPTPTAQDYGSNRSPTTGAATRPSLGTMARHEMWPTPLAAEGGPDYAKIERGNRQSGKGLSLATTVNLRAETFPTPTATDHKGRGKGSYDRHKGLDNHVKIWPTPTSVHNNPQVRGEGKTIGTKRGTTLAGAARKFPTPTARDSKGGYNTKSLTRKDGKSRTLDGLPNAVLDGKGTETVTGSLNPDWVEWLMGFPVGHTDLSSSETPSYLSWPSYMAEPSSNT